jgi:hypothetical protein
MRLLLYNGRSQWARGLGHELSSPARTLGSWVRIPLQVRMFAFILCLCRQRPCDELIPRPRSPTDCLRIKKLKWNKAFHGWPMLQSGSNRKERDRLSKVSSLVEVIPSLSFSTASNEILNWTKAFAQGRRTVPVLSVKFPSVASTKQTVRNIHKSRGIRSQTSSDRTTRATINLY